MKMTVPNVNVIYSNTFYISVEVCKTIAVCGLGAVLYIIHVQYNIIKYTYPTNCNLTLIYYSISFNHM